MADPVAVASGIPRTVGGIQLSPRRVSPRPRRVAVQGYTATPEERCTVAATKQQKAATSKKTIASLPAKTKTALGKQGAAVAQRKGTGGTTPKTKAELYEIA